MQFHNLIPTLNVVENITLPILMDRRKVNEERLNDLLDLLGLKDRKTHLPNQLSGGQQQRVAIARSLVNDPVVILADEATGNLDSRTSYEIMSLFQELNDKGKTIVFVTHEQDIAKFTKRSVIFRDGHIIREQEVTDRSNAKEMLAALPETTDFE